MKQLERVENHTIATRGRQLIWCWNVHVPCD